jgi:hypothetical protein
MPKRCCISQCICCFRCPPSFGQYVPVVQTCTRDITTLCAASQPGSNPLAECVKTHFQDFSEPCQAALMKIASVRDACRSDIRHQCSATRPGRGRTLLCVRRRFAALSEPCKDAIGQAAERKVGTH